jgi:hypothetical protein
MAKPQAADPVKLFVAILWAEHAALDQSLRLLTGLYGPEDFTGPDRAFDITRYYEREMGSALYRRLVSFQSPVSPEFLVQVKLDCNSIEDRLAGAAGRRVNLDAGYLDHNKVVLASNKGAGQKIYLGRGVYADLVGRYRRGRYRPFEWTFPDFRDGRYDPELAAMRRIYLDQLRAFRQGAVNSIALPPEKS